jgi:hypothetical protein
MIYYFCVFYDTDLDSLKRDFYVEYFIGCMYLICNLLFPFFFFHFFSLYVFFYDDEELPYDNIDHFRDSFKEEDQDKNLEMIY